MMTNVWRCGEANARGGGGAVHASKEYVLCHTLYLENIKRNDAQLPPVSCRFPAASRISFVPQATESSTRSPRACSRVSANNLKRAQCTHLAAPRPSRNAKASARSRGQSIPVTVSN